MKRLSVFKKAIGVLLASLFVFLTVFETPVQNKAVSAAELTPQQEKAQLEQRIKEAQNKLDELEEQSAGTQEYFNTLTDKITYLDRQYELVSNEADEDKKQVEILENTYDKNEQEISSIGVQIEQLQKDCAAAEDEFSGTYQAFKKRMRAMYISGETNMLVFLITCDDISQFLTRLEMVKRVSEMDGELLESINSEIDKINNTRSEITKKRAELQVTQAALESTKNSLEAAIPELEQKQQELEDKKAQLDTERGKANDLLTQLNEETGNYTEYIEDNKAAMAEVDAAIEAAEQMYQNQNTTTTTKPATTQNTGGNSEDEKTTGSQSENETVTEKETAAQSSGSSGYINLTYPVPSQTTITCGYGEYSGHSGADFSCPTGSSVVAAESGTVIISADLTNPDGSYRSYGRYIVIMHDKKTSSGDNVFTLYAHNSERLVSQGQHVEKGQQIAKSGSTGNSTGPHCHFEVRTPSSSYSACKNPALYLP